jgi:hypothetical protein
MYTVDVFMVNVITDKVLIDKVSGEISSPGLLLLSDIR